MERGGQPRQRSVEGASKERRKSVEGASKERPPRSIKKKPFIFIQIERRRNVEGTSKERQRNVLRRCLVKIEH